MDFDVGQVVAESSDSGSGDQLTVIEFYPLEIMTRHQMVKRLVCDERKVVQLEDRQVLRGAGSHAQLTNALVRDELTVRQADGLQTGAAGGQGAQRRVRDQDALLQVHPLEQMAVASEGLQKERFFWCREAGKFFSRKKMT